jgi:L-lactate utilization protein LutC
MNARTTILQRVRAATRGAERAPAIVTAGVRGPAPVIRGSLADRFRERAERLASDVVACAAMQDVPAAVARYLAAKQLPARAVCWPAVAALPWAAAGIAVEARGARGDDLVGVTGVFCAIAETGTLMLLSGADTPATASLLPETHVAIVSTADIVATMEDGFARLRAAAMVLPRAVNFVSGPSRTADIEQTVTLGAHGPYRVLIVLVGG